MTFVTEQVKLALIASKLGKCPLTYEAIDEYDYIDVVESTAYDIKYANALLDTIKHYEYTSNSYWLTKDAVEEAIHISETLYNFMMSPLPTMNIPTKAKQELQDLIEESLKYRTGIERALAVFYTIYNYADLGDYTAEAAFIAANIISYSQAKTILVGEINECVKIANSLEKYSNKGIEQFIKKVGKYFD